MSAPVPHAAALMSADQYRLAAQQMLDQAMRVEPAWESHFVELAQVYALLAISAQAAENREDVPF